MKQWYQFFILFLISSGLIACSPVKMPDQTTYTLNASPMNVTPGKPTNKVLLVTTPQAAAAFNTSKMAYVQKPYQVQYFTLNKWIAQPNYLLTPLITNTLIQTHHFTAVVASPYSGHADYRLDSQLIKLQQNFLVKPSEEELSIQVNLIDENTQQLIASKQFDLIATASDNTPYSGVVAANRAVADFLGQLTQFVNSAV